MTTFELIALTLRGKGPRPVLLNGHDILWWDGETVQPIINKTTETHGRQATQED